MLAQIEKCETGTCVWCKGRGEGVHAKFEFGLQGFFCKKDFWTALKVRLEAKNESEVVELPKAGRPS